MTKRILVTGANGFVGSNALMTLLEQTDWDVIVPTTALHRGTQTRINRILEHTSADRSRIRLVRCDLAQPFHHNLFGGPAPDYIWNIASQSHVDRALEDPRSFVENNVRVMLNVLEYAREVQPSLMLHMSTDEVFGPAEPGEYHREWEPLRPSNPYSASKAAQEALAYSYFRSFNLPVAITNTMNLIAPGPGYQHSEKFVPMVIKKVLNGDTVGIHATPEGVSGSRCWIDARDFTEAWLFLTRELDGRKDLTYYPVMGDLIRFNVVGPEESNYRVAENIAEELGIQPKLELVNFHTSRPGHDPRYALDGTKLAEFGWKPRFTNKQTIADIVEWYREFPETLED